MGNTRDWPRAHGDDLAGLILTPTLTGHDGLSCLARQFVDAVAAWDPKGAHVIALANGTAAGAVWPAQVRVTDCRGSRAAFVWRTLEAAGQATPPSVVVSMHAHVLPAAWPLLMRGAPLVPVLVGVETWTPLSWPRRRVLTHARRAIAISRHTAAEFRRANPRFDALPIDVCWPATPPLAPARPQAATSRPGFALIVGRLASEERYKGHDLLIDVWPEVRHAIPDARLVVAGTGDDEARLRARVEAAGLANAIEFVGAQTPADLAALYRDCAFLVMPSRHEGFGFVFLEAMASGRACIGGRGAAEEIIVPNSTGLIVDPDRPADLRDALVALFGDPQLCARMGEAGHRRAREVFSIERFRRELAHHLARHVPEMVTTPC